jgi:hypothetical protein
MSSFWPEGLSVNDMQSPCEILEIAREEWETASNGALTLVIEQTEAERENAKITVHAKHVPSKRTATLFSVIHRLNVPYPVTIEPREDDLPKILKKSYYEPGIIEFDLRMDEGRTVKNEWVSDTPSEFREKLSKAFNLSVVKSAILNLTSNIQK